MVSTEADLLPLNDPPGARAVDAAIGGGSAFRETYGYYAHGVGPETAKAPAGRQGRLVRIDVEPRMASSRRRTGWCLEPHDVMLAKLTRGDERDWRSIETAVRERLAEPSVSRDMCYPCLRPTRPVWSRAAKVIARAAAS